MADEKKPNNSTPVKEDELTDDELGTVAGGIIMPIDSNTLQSTSLTTSTSLSTSTSSTFLSSFKNFFSSK